MFEVTDLKELKKLLQLCRAQGVQEITLGAVSFKLGDLPVEASKQTVGLDETGNPYENFPQGELSQEQLMFYSAGGLPEDDPYRKDQ